ncbi:unnamed protein product [Echinostoma caproni]|uniref:Transposase n=1 Tax=Echinostoma caproni TaxID=27848 RepID=A0A183AUF6_9TREM|nr:unnamed protein product [Echinostoma caproni]
MTAVPIHVSDVLDNRFDVVVFVNDDIDTACAPDAVIHDALKSFSKVNPQLSHELAVVPFPAHPCGRLVSFRPIICPSPDDLPRFDFD